MIDNIGGLQHHPVEKELLARAHWDDRDIIDRFDTFSKTKVVGLKDAIDLFYGLLRSGEMSDTDAWHILRRFQPILERFEQVDTYEERRAICGELNNFFLDLYRAHASFRDAYDELVFARFPQLRGARPESAV